MRHENIILAVSCISSLVMGLIVLIRAPKKRANQILSLFVFGVAWWMFSLWGFLNYRKNPESAINWFRLVYSGPIIIPAALLYFTYLFPSYRTSEYKKIYAIIFVPMILLMLSLPTKIFLENSSSLSTIIKPTFGRAYPLFLGYFIIFMLWTFMNLGFSYRKSRGIDKEQIKLIVAGFLIGTIIALVTNVILPLVGETAYVFNGPSLAVIILLYFTTYAIVRHRFMDITVIIRRGAVYASLVVAITIIYALIVVGWQTYIMDYWPVVLNPIVAAGLAGAIIALGYRPLEGFLEGLTARIFYRGKYDYQEVVSQVSNSLAEVHDVKQLAEVITRTLTQQMKLKGAALLEYLDRQGIYRVAAVASDSKAGYLNKRDYGSDDPLIYVLGQLRQPIIAEEWERELQEKQLSALEKHPRQLALAEMKDQQIALALPLDLQDRTLGQLFLGAKNSGDAFTGQDLRLLNTLADQAAMVMEKMILYEQAQNNERLSSLGALSASIAQELSRPLSQIRDMTDKLNAKIKDRDYIREFCRVVPGQIQGLFDLVMGLLNYAKPAAAEFKKVPFANIIYNVLQLMGQNLRRSGIDVVLDLQDWPEMDIDQEQIAQALVELILSSLRSMAEQGGGQLTITAKIKADRQTGVQKKFVLTIGDTGPGYTEAQASRLFDPFYAADVRAGGLGMALVRNIVQEKHRGDFRVVSRSGQRTEYEIELPLVQSPETGSWQWPAAPAEVN